MVLGPVSLHLGAGAQDGIGALEQEVAEAPRGSQEGFGPRLSAETEAFHHVFNPFRSFLEPKKGRKTL